MAPYQETPRPASSLDPGIASLEAASGVSWGAIFAGAVAAAALSLILVLLGTGLGLSSISPWTERGASATTLGVATILWITFTQIAASGIGGYMAGRLRTRWTGVRTDEVYFRDTAHGLLAWSVATLLTAATLTSTLGAILGTGAQAGASLAGSAATGLAPAAAGLSTPKTPDEGDTAGPAAYFVDSLFRPDPGAAANPAAGSGAAPASPPTGEASRILLNALRAGALPADDTRYLGQVVAQRTGLSQPDAEKRVTETFNRAKAAQDEARDKAKAAADAARKSSAYASLWLFVSLLVGAFVASYLATHGGRRRDL
jgi:hypothetical protein